MASLIGVEDTKTNNVIVSAIALTTGYVIWTYADELQSYGKNAPYVAAVASAAILAYGGWIAAQKVIKPIAKEFEQEVSDRFTAVKKWTFDRSQLTNLGVILGAFGLISLWSTLWCLSTSDSYSSAFWPAVRTVGSAAAFSRFGKDLTYKPVSSGPVGGVNSVKVIEDENSLLHFDHKFVFKMSNDPNPIQSKKPSKPAKPIPSQPMYYSSVGAAFEASKFEDEFRGANHHLFQNRSAEEIREVLIEYQQRKPDDEKFKALRKDWYTNNPGAGVLNKYLEHAIRFQFGVGIKKSERLQGQKDARYELAKTGKATLSHPDISYPGSPALSGSVIAAIMEQVRGEAEAEDAKLVK